MLSTFFYPDGITYIIVKLVVLLLVVLLWLAVTSAPVV